MKYKIEDGKHYVIGNAAEVLEEYESEAAVIALDDAWAFPQRITRFDADFTTHPFDESQDDVSSSLNVDDSVTTTDILDSCYDALQDGGWLIADAEDWLLPHLIQYLKEEWGDAAQTDDEYDGGGYRRTGGVTYLNSKGEPERNSDRKYFSSGGYSVVFAHKGKTDRQTTVSVRQFATRPEKWNDENVKPFSPYETWLGALMEPDELLLVPCAATAPAAIAAERELDSVRYACIDTDEEWVDVFKKRRSENI
ncbi:hypothetical protein [Haladaptatus caseinilyticus]|uniref:hypothetical protein n=1 Tax=Haladaptatus caseinilyticus TaxID=2993314 RepID=UPI00224B5A4A|nr:hypothetical protein [Haladaptatus caseinilyticus]